MPQRQCGLFSSGGRPRSRSPSVSSGVVMSMHVRARIRLFAPPRGAALVTPATTAVLAQSLARSLPEGSALDTAFLLGPILPDAYSDLVMGQCSSGHMTDSSER